MIIMCVIMTIESVQVHLDNDEDLVTLSGMYEQLKELGYNLSYARCSSYRCWSKTDLLLSKCRSSDSVIKISLEYCSKEARF